MSDKSDSVTILAELRTDVKHILAHMEKQNGRVSRLEVELHDMEIEQTKIKTKY